MHTPWNNNNQKYSVEFIKINTFEQVVMAQQQQNVPFDKPTDSSQKELTRQLQEASESNKELEDKLKGLEGKLSTAEQEKAQLQKVPTINCLVGKTMCYIIIDAS